MHQTNRGESGYSLTEMLTVVAIIGVFALIMVPNFMSFYQSNKMKTSMRNLTTDLRSARQIAITQGRQAMLTYGTGATARTYDLWLGNRPFNSTTWTRQTGPGLTRATKEMDSVVYFPPDPGSPATTQTFTDSLDCSTGTNCVAGTDTKLDILFFPDGRVQLPPGLTTGTITIKTDIRIPRPLYTITISPSGRVLAQ
jgi:prepilin-type N-terminal cleavage/methylation domain-containing protein